MTSAAHFLPLDFKTGIYGAGYYESKLVLVRALKVRVPTHIKASLSEASNLRLPVNPGLKNASQTIVAPATKGGAT